MLRSLLQKIGLALAAPGALAAALLVAPAPARAALPALTIPRARVHCYHVFARRGGRDGWRLVLTTLDSDRVKDSVELLTARGYQVRVLFY